jgi:hypothetical protein
MMRSQIAAPEPNPSPISAQLLERETAFPNRAHKIATVAAARPMRITRSR